MRTVPTLLIAATLLTATSSAMAETAPGRYDAACDDPTFAPHTGAVVPANTPGYPFQVKYGEYGFAIRHSSFELVDTHVDVDPSTIGGQLLLPLAPLTEGSYALHFNSPCNPSYMSSDHSQARVFTIGPAQPLPTKAGTLTLVGDTFTESAEWCSDVRATRKIRIDIDPLLVPFLATTKVSLSERGMIRTDYGNFPGTTSTITLAASCEHSYMGGPPTTNLTLGAYLAGVADLESTSLAVPFLCDPDAIAKCKKGVPTPADSGPPYPGDSGRTTELPGNTLGDDDSGSSSKSSSGCSLHDAADATSTGATTFVLGAALTVLQLARSRRRRAA